MAEFLDGSQYLENRLTELLVFSNFPPPPKTSRAAPKRTLTHSTVWTPPISWVIQQLFSSLNTRSGKVVLSPPRKMVRSWKEGLGCPHTMWILVSIFWHEKISKAVKNSLWSGKICKFPLSKPAKKAAGWTTLDSGILLSTAWYPKVTL